MILFLMGGYKMGTEELSDKVYKKLKNEYKNYIEELSKFNISSIIEKSYETAIKNEMVETFYYNYKYSEEDYKERLEEENLLNSLYKNWMDSDYGISNVLDLSIDDYVSNLSDREEYYER